jgi:phage I-like protein
MPDQDHLGFVTLFEGQLSDAFPVLEAGEYPTRRMTVTEDHLDKMVANFKALSAEGVEFPLDYDHSFAEGGSSEASGWYRELFRDGKRLMARVEWTEPAKSKIRDKLFRFFSAEWHFNWKDEHGKKWGPTMLAGTLTNRPFLKRLGEVRMSERAASAAADELPDEVIEKLADRIDQRSGKAAERRAEMTDQTVTAAEHKALADKLDEATTKLGELTRRVDKAESKNEALSEALDAQKTRADDSEKALLNERVSGDLAAARRKGQIDEKDETTTKWTERAEKLGLETFRELLAELPENTIPVSTTGHGRDRETATEAPDGVDERSHRAHERAEEIAAEKKISYEEAATIAYREVYEGATA